MTMMLDNQTEFKMDVQRKFRQIFGHCGYLLANVDCQGCKGPIIECLLFRYCQHTTLPVEGCSTRSGTYYGLPTRKFLPDRNHSPTVPAEDASEADVNDSV